MNRVESRLRHLEHAFVGWFVAQAVLGTWVAWRVLEDLRRTWPFLALDGVTLNVVVTSAAMAELALLALGIVLFQFVLRRRRVARLVVLVVAWISVASACVGLLGAPAMPHLARALSGASVLANALSLAFWAWTILVLQFDAQVRSAFSPAGP